MEEEKQETAGQETREQGSVEQALDSSAEADQRWAAEKDARANQPNRRKREDAMFKAVQFLLWTGWILVIAALMLIENARPQAGSFYDSQVYELTLQQAWEAKIAGYATFTLLSLLVVAVMGVLINKARSRRRLDTFYFISFTAQIMFGLFGSMMFLIFL